MANRPQQHGVDPTKPVMTKGGLPARIVCTDVIGVYPWFVLILDQATKKESGYYYSALGQMGGGNGNHPHDLVNIKVKRWRWVIADKGSLSLTDHYYTENEVLEYCTKHHYDVVTKATNTLREDDE